MTRKTRAQKKRDSKKKNDRTGIIIIAVVVVIVILAFVLQRSMLKNQVTLDTSTNCPSNIQEEVVVLIDVTDSLNRTQSHVVNEVVRREVFSSSVDTRFNFYLITETVEDFSTMLTICNPGDGSDANELVANKRRLYQRWEQDFKRHIDEIMDRLHHTPEARQSPIVEGLKIASVENFYNSPAVKKRLILISDLLEHSSGLSHYRTDYEPQLSQTSRFLRENRPHLSMVDIDIYYISRADVAHLQSNRHVLFWRTFLEDSGGKIRHLEVVR